MTQPHRRTNTPRSSRAPSPVPPLDPSLLAAALHATGALVLVVDPQGRIVHFNQACEASTGWRAEEVNGRSVWEFLTPPEDVARQRELLEGMSRGETTTRLTASWLTRSGGRRWGVWSTTGLRADDGSLRYLIATGIDVTEQREAEEAARAREARFRAAMDGAGDGIFIIGPDTRFLDVNDRAAQMVGYTREELLALRVTDLLVPEETEARPLDVERLSRAEPGLEVRRIRRKDGSILFAEIHARRDPAGWDVSVVRDITDRRQAEEALRRSRDRYRNLVESDVVGMISFRVDGQVTWANDAFRTMVGVSREDVDAGRVNWKAMTPPEYLAADLWAMERLMETGKCPPFEKEYLRPDGRRIPVLVGGVLLHRGQETGVAYIFDLTERRRVEERLADSEHRLERARKLASIGTFDADLATFTAVFSEDMCVIYGVPPASNPIDYERFTSLIHPDDRARVEGVIRQAIERAEPYQVEHRVTRPDGSVRIVEAAGEPVLDSAGRPLRLLGAVRDITERRALEQRLSEAQKIEAIGRLAGGVAQDFNNLLTSILGHNDALLADLAPQDPGRACALGIRDAARRAAFLTQQLLAFAQRQMLEPRVLDLNALVMEMHDVLQRLVGETIELVSTPAAPRGLVRVDPGQVQQVLMNLALNGRDAMPGGGRLEVAVRNVERPVPGAPPDAALEAQVELSVRDSGVGMAPDVVARVFDPFFTTKSREEGIGLGLSTVHGIVHQSGGEIEVESAPGQGTLFRVYLPCVTETGEALRVGPDSTTAPRGECILLVEDETAVRTLVAEALRRQGYEVLEASEGDEALAQAAAHERPIALLIADVVLPGMSGRELAERIQVPRPQIRVLFISGYTDEAIGHHGVKGPSASFLQKPFTPATLGRKVRQVLNAPSRR